MNLPNRQRLIVAAAVAARVLPGVINVVECFADHSNDRVLNQPKRIFLAGRKWKSHVGPRENRFSHGAPREAKGQFDDNSAGASIEIRHDDVEITVVFYSNLVDLAGDGVPLFFRRNSPRGMRNC
jgi:hypothetical protein